MKIVVAIVVVILVILVLTKVFIDSDEKREVRNENRKHRK